MSEPILSLSNPILSLRQLTVLFPHREPGMNPDRESHPVVNQLSVDLYPGQTLGIVGESGSGKTMTALSVMGLLPHSAQVQGSIFWQRSKTDPPQNVLTLSPSQWQHLRGKHIGMIFQEPGTVLNPVYTCGFQLVETLRIHEQISVAAARDRAAQLLEEVQMPHPARIMERYPHQLSGGQIQRVMIAIAIACNPALLIADEPTTALDVTIQAQILQLLRRLRDQRGMAMVFISHDLGLMAEIADHVVVMYRGQAVEQGPIRDIFAHPQHPYTQGLLACRPRLNRLLNRLPTLEDYLSPTGAPLHPDPSPERIPSQIDARLHRLQQQPPLLQVKDLKIYFPILAGVFKQKVGEVRAVDGVSFDLYPGETLGLVGESGSGKSTLGRAILRLVKATSGQVIYDGDELLTLRSRRWKPLRRHLQLIFQDPYSSLNPRMAVGEAVMEPLTFHGMGGSRAERLQRVRSLLTQVGLDPDVWQRMPHEFSGGQRQRICIARALAAEPRLIICDECVSALDVSIQAQVLNLLKQLQEELGLTYLFISHDLSVVQFMSDRILVLNKGQMEELSTATQIYTDPQREYTRQLIAAIPSGF